VQNFRHEFPHDRGAPMTAPIHPTTKLSTNREARVAAIAFPVFVALTVFAFGLALLLSLTPLWETPDTSCKTVWTAPPDCSEIVTRREHWIVIVVGLGVLTLCLAIVTWRRRARLRKASPLVPTLMLLGVLVGLGGAAYLTIGDNYSMCGSTLSRVDPFGDYDPGRPHDCASSYSHSRTTAWLLGAIAVGGIAWANVSMQTGAALRPGAAPSLIQPPNGATSTGG